MSKGFGFNLDHLNVTAEDWSVIKAYEGREPHPTQASKVIDLSEGVIGIKTSIETRSASGRQVNMRGARRALDSMLADVDSITNSRPDDIAPKPSDTEDMSDINREELDAKLSAVEARMDRRIADFQSDMRQAVSDFRLEIQPLKGMKANIWSATAVMVGTIVAVVGLSFTAFDSGRETSELVQEAKQQATETRKLLEQIQAQQKSMVTPPASAPPSAKE
ncbi:hypothetical protein RCO22_10710 [Pseudomonas yamanorum]|uniref:Uncharacterized protein n=1 Tax=Pseudomonas yamanorum TaxID=515393 RepID=A0ABU1CQ65_9PSED|nr:hypothetical protein [Pseudomonas yamanorum]MDR0189409.1 hypothetical protein [Pseudomonas yamanorum]